MIERAIATLLLNALWEPLAVAAGAFAVLRIARTASAATRCAVLTSAIVAALILPPLTSAMVYRAQTFTVTAPSPAQTRAHAHAAVQRTSALPVIRRARETQQSSPVAPLAVQHAVLSVPRGAVIAIVIAWAAVALALLARLLFSLAYLGRLRRDALPLSPDLRVQLQRWSEKASGIDVRLCLSDQTVVPIAVGLFDCMVLIPRRLLEELEPADLDRIVLHEIAHLRRRDGLVYAVQQIANALYFFSPGIAWMSRSLDIEREVACDDWVCERSADAAPYANCLVRLAEGVPWPHKALAAPGAFVTRHSMSIRIERILQRARDARLHAAPAPVAAAIVAAGVVAAVGLSFAPSLAYPAVARARSVTHARAVVPKPHAHVAEHPSHMHVAPPIARVAVVTKAATPASTPSVTRTAVPVRNSAKRKLAVSKPLVQASADVRMPAGLPDTATLVAVRTPDPDGDYIDQMRALFGSGVSVEDLVALKSMGVTPVYVQQMRAAGLDVTKASRVVAARSVGLTPEKLTQLRNTFGPMSFDDIMALTSLHVDTAYRSELQAAGLANLTPQRLIELKSVGVTGDYVRQANALGFGKLSEEQLLELKSMHIDSAYIQRVRQHGFQNLTLEQLVQLRASGVIK